MAKCCVLLLTSLWIISNCAAFTEMFSPIAHFANDIIESRWKMLENHSYLELNTTIEQKQAELFQKIRNVSEELQHLESTSAISYDVLADDIISIRSDLKDKPFFSGLFETIVQIDGEFERLRGYSEERLNVDSTTMIDFAKEVVTHRPTSTKMIMYKILQYLSPEVKSMHHGGLLKLLADNMNDTSVSPNPLLPNLFDKIALVEIKGYAMVEFSFVILDMHGQGNYSAERNLASNKFRKELKEFYQKIIRMLTNQFRHDQKEDEEEYFSIANFAQNINSSWITVEDLELNKTTQQKQTRTSKKISKVADVFWQLEQHISSKIIFDLFPNVVKSTMKYFRNESLILDLYSCMQHIDKSFELLLEYSEDEDFDAMINLANETISSQPNSIKMLMKKIHRIIFPEITYESHNGLMNMLADNIEPPDEIIRITGESPNQLLYNLFNRIVLAQMKAYALVQFSYVILEVYGKGYYLTESKLANKKIRKILMELSQETIQAIAKVSRHYWRPDPEEYTKGDNYLEISRLLQGYVANENILNNDAPCNGKCDIFKEIKITNCPNDPFCRNQTRCGGKVYSCRSLNTTDMKICLSPTGTTRRYNYIEYDNHNVLGAKSTCPMPIMNVKARIGWCPYCMCLCDDEIFYSDRYFSLREAVSNTTKNKVVTGIKFTKINRIIYLQVQQGEVLPYGRINATSLEWVPVDKFSITGKDVYDTQDYLKMTSNNKAVNLHIIQIDNEKKVQQVLTGVRFAAVKFGADPSDERTHLSLEIRMTKFHFESGKLFPTKSGHTWFPNRTTEVSPDNPRTRIPTENLDIPTRARSRNTIISKGDQFVEFTHTDIYKDAGQTTIPFIDIQNVVTELPTPLVGAGLYYKATPGYGGFIGLKIVTYDFTKHL